MPLTLYLTKYFIGESFSQNECKKVMTQLPYDERTKKNNRNYRYIRLVSLQAMPIDTLGFCLKPLFGPF